MSSRSSVRFSLLTLALFGAVACSQAADSAGKNQEGSVQAARGSSAPIVATVATANTPASSASTAPSAPAAASGATLYTVVDKTHVDPNTLMGWKTWRAQACERCHGAQQEGLVGPSLINSLKVLTKDEFLTTLKNGRIEKGMPNFGGVPNVVANLDNLYAYLKGRSDGAIAPGRLEAISK